jgi:SAM-dependent methyltransferase
VAGPVAYARSASADAMFRDHIRAALDAGARSVCDVGGGAKPTVPLERIAERQLSYVVLDVSAEQLERAPGGYARMAASITDRDAVASLAQERGPFDLVVSRWTAEHVRDGRAFHEGVHTLLRPGGTAVHLFPTLYALPFVVNRLLTPALSSAVLFRTCPGRHAKFPPYYSWCRGPSPRQLRRIESVGFTIDSYTGFFGHDFYASVPPLRAAHRWAAERLVAHPRPTLTSFAVVALTRAA